MSVLLTAVSNAVCQPAVKRRLIEAIEFRNEIVHPKDRPRGAVTFVGLEHVESHTGCRVGSDQIHLEEMTGRRSRFSAGDIVYGYLRPYLNKVWVAEFDGICSVDQYVFKVRPIADRNYIAHFLRSAEFLKTAPIASTPGQLPRIRSAEIAETPVLLPPIDEQRRIAAILDQADDLRRKRRKAIDCLRRLAQAIFVTELDGSHHPNRPLSEVCSLITDGTHYTPTYADEGIIFLSAKNVTSGKIDWDDVKHIPETLHRELQKRVSPKRDDVLLAKNGTTGVAALVDRDIVFDIYVSLALLRAGHQITPPFLLAALNSPSSTKQFRKSLKGIGVPNLHLKDIRATIIPIPPLDLQQRFAARIAEIDKVIDSHRTHLAQLDALFASLQHRAFRGEL